jgi:hypothetical protein
LRASLIREFSRREWALARIDEADVDKVGEV